MANNGRSIKDRFSRVTLTAVPDTAGGELVASPSIRRVDLNTVDRCRREMSRVYREVREGLIESTEGAKQVYILAATAKLIVDAALEARLRALERAAG